MWRVAGCVSIIVESEADNPHHCLWQLRQVRQHMSWTNNDILPALSPNSSAQPTWDLSATRNISGNYEQGKTRRWTNVGNIRFVEAATIGGGLYLASENQWQNVATETDSATVCKCIRAEPEVPWMIKQAVKEIPCSFITSWLVLRKIKTLHML